MLSKINRHSRDSRIRFRDDGHKYWIDNSDIGITSCTTYIKSFFEEFKTDNIINKIINSDKYNNPDYKYYNKTPEQIKKMWNETRDSGTNLHKCIEDYYNNITVDNDSIEFNHFLQFIDDNPSLKIYRTEWLIFSDIHKITGAIDAVFINDDNTLSIGDWKRIENVEYTGFNDKKALYPINHLDDCNFTHYALQLNLYKYIIENYYDFKVKDLFLILLHPNNKSYSKIDVPNLQEDIKLLFDLRLKHIEDKSSDIKLTKHGLSEKQQLAYDLVLTGKNVFITSQAGAGKSFLIKLIYAKYQDVKHIAITSTTGTSAILINGVTLHSYLGIGLGNSDVSSLYLMIQKRYNILRRWKDLEILIIDEISMLSPILFDKLENLARVIRRNTKPFGGIQLVLSGDYCQLPVVGESDSFCFDAESWNACVDNIVYLTENFRQDDIIFKNCLNEIRLGNMSKETIDILKSRSNIKLTNEFGILPTKIYSLNKDVNAQNDKELQKLFSKNDNLQFYEYELEYEVLKKGLRNIDDIIYKACNCPFSLQLCVGAQVMLLYNLDIESKLVNGSRGIIIGFENDLPRVKFINGITMIIDYKTWTLEENGTTILQWTQIPLKVAFAVSCHKVQGITIDYAEVDLSNIFEYSQAYVALSRVRSLEGLSIKNFNIQCFKVNPRALDFYKNLS